MGGSAGLLRRISAGVSSWSLGSGAAPPRRAAARHGAPPAAVADRYPSELSGGQKQRINLARALDTVVGAAILELLDELRRELHVAYMFISHDLSTVRAICDEDMILHAGQKVESGSRTAMQRAPLDRSGVELLAHASVAAAPEIASTGR